MNRHGLSAAAYRAVCTAMTQTHRVRVRVKLLDLDEKHLADLTGKLLDGQVDIDTTQPVSRKATVILYDPRRVVPFDSDSPADTALYLDRMLRVIYEVLVNGAWVELPIFTGPVTGLSRNGKQVTVDCQGKEWLSMGACWAPLALDKRMKKTDAIRRILAERAGETKFNLPDLPARLPKPVTLGPDAVPWDRAKQLAATMDQHLYYDGSGRLHMSRHTGDVAFAFTSEKHITGDPQIAFDGSNVVNAVRVVGHRRGSGSQHVHYEAVAHARHPLSPTRLGRNGVPRYLTPSGGTIRDDNIKNHAEAVARGSRALADGLRQPVTVSFDSIPGPGAFLDPLDLCRAHTEDGAVTFRLHQMSMPLLAGQSMTIGYNDNRLTRTMTRHPKHRRRTTPRKRR